MKYNKFLHFVILLSLISTIVFGFIEALLFLVSEDTVQIALVNAGLNIKSAEILTSALSTAIAIFVATWIEGYIMKNFDVVRHPALSALGIIIGAIIFVILYNLYNLIV